MKKILLLSLIITLPVNIFFYVWSYNTLTTYFRFDEYKRTISKGVRLHRIGLSSFYELQNKTKYLLGINRPSDVKLFIKDNRLMQIKSDLPSSGSEYKSDSYLLINNAILKGKAKLRGDNFYHWAFPHKSWRFKTSKNNSLNYINKYNFIIPKSNEMLNNHLSYKLARILGILAPESKLVELSINGEYRGIRLMVEQIDESFLRKNRRMPNDIYTGDNMGQKSYKAVAVSAFENASIWGKASENNHYANGNVTPLSNLLKDIKNNNYDLYDIKSFAAMAAFVDLVSSFHYTPQHNWRLNYDNYLERMYPIIWDPVGWLKGWVRKDRINISNSMLFDSLYLNFDFIREKTKIIHSFFNFQENEFYRELNTSIQYVEKYIALNKHTYSMQRLYMNEVESYAALNTFKENVIKRLELVKDYYIGNVESNNYSYSVLTNTIRLSVSGNKLVQKIEIQLDNSIQVKNAFINYSQRSDIKTHDILSRLTNSGKTLTINIELLANAKISHDTTSQKFIFTEATYDLKIEGINNLNVKGVKLSTLGSKETFLIQKKDQINIKPINPKLHNIIPEFSRKETLVWSGKKQFSNFNEFNNNVIINKGTTLYLDSKATIKILGKVTAIGTKESPIIFQALDDTKPWGAIALKDEAANGSVFKHVIFKGGSGDKGDMHEYTAMLSIHNVKDVLIEDSEFYDSKITDDMVHVIYSEVMFKNSKFVRSLSDALDVDISNVVIDNCEFIDSGNDSIDLMATNAVVTNTKFYNSADKGISIGEGSNLLAVNNLIVASEIGMQSKDTSRAYIYNSSFIDNKKAIDAYHKNWRYSEGGTIYLDNIILQGNEINASVGKKSKVIINNSQIDTPENFDKKSILKKNITISNKDYIPYEFRDPFFQNHDDLIDRQAKGYHE